MTSTQTISLDWSTIGIITGLVTVIMGVATTYLKLFISQSMTRVEKEVISAVKLEFANKEVTESKLDAIYSRLRTLESVRG